MRTFAQGQKPTRQTKSGIAKAQHGTFAAQPHKLRSILHLQRTIGNQAVQRLLQQAKPDYPLGHELAHVVRQTHGPRVLARQTVEQYETRGVQIDPTALDTLVELGYWEQKIRSVFHLSMDLPTDTRLQANTEEKDAVLSVVFQMLPKTTVTRVITNVVTIPKRAAARASKDLAYQITLRPRTTPNGHDIVEVLFVNEGPGATPVAPDPPSTSFTPKPVAYNTFSFPQNPDSYWQAHREEQRRVFSWIETKAPGPRFDQVITTTVTSRGTTRSTSFAVRGTKATSSGRISDLNITFLGAVAHSRKAAPDGYASHDFADQSIEEVRTPADPNKPDKLGAINGLGVLPRAEQPSVKFAISQYFKNGTRNAEVDAIVPIVEGSLFAEVMAAKGLAPKAQDMAAEYALSGIRLIKPRRVLYTFRFTPNSNAPHTHDVDIQRIGEEGKEVSLAPQGDLARVNGFSDHTKGKAEQDVQPLKGWLKTRYPGVTPVGDTIAEVEKDVTAQIRAGSDDRRWYETNYGIKILNKTEAEARLKSIGHKEPEELKDLKDFSKTDLKVLELVLETMSGEIVKTFKGLQLIRQKMFNKWKGPSSSDFEPQPSVGGVTIQGTTRTTIIFDHASVNADALFLGGIGSGGKPAVTTATVQTYAHELGHTVAKRPGVQKAFDKLVATKHIKPITWYADSDPPKELFAESFALYYSDPGWLQQNWPDLYNFFQRLDSTGKP